jgi:SAM-dependent methyltransferase
MSNYLGGCILESDIGTWSPEVWDKLIEIYKPKNMIDVGCGAGHSTKYFQDNGVNSVGVEAYLPAIEVSQIKEKIIIHDYVLSEFIPDDIFDLAWCCEFVEHVEEIYLNNFMKTFTKCKIVAMTHALPGQIGYHHVNCKSPEYWIDKFKEFGFCYEKEFSHSLRDLIPDTNGKFIKNTLMVFKNEKI